MPGPQGRVAFVTGVNGISGNAIVEYLIRQPESEWSRIIISSRSPLKYFWQDPRVEFVAVDFLDPVDKLVEKLSPLAKDVTHAYFTSYIHNDDHTKLKAGNAVLFENFLTAIDTVAGRSLQRVCLQTGGKNYGLHLGPTPSPASEYTPRYDDQGHNFYFAQEDFMFQLKAQRTWSWNVIRPGGIIGFTPGQNGMNEALTLAMYLLVHKELGEAPQFPGNELFYNIADDKSYAPSIADLTIWATTHDHTANEAFNHANGDVFLWKYGFKRFGEHFGMDIPFQTSFAAKGGEGVRANDFSIEEWAKDKQPVWDRLCDRYGGNKEAFKWGTWEFLGWALGKAWPTLLSINKARAFGWTLHVDTLETYVQSFKMFENGGILPKSDLLRRSWTAPAKVASIGNGRNGHTAQSDAQDVKAPLVSVQPSGTIV